MRRAFLMKLKPGFESEYQKRHNNIWPELKSMLSESGIKNYTIYLDKKSDTLFATQELNDKYKDEELNQNEIMKKWWDYMADIMETNPDNSPKVVQLNEVFHMD